MGKSGGLLAVRAGHDGGYAAEAPLTGKYGRGVALPHARAILPAQDIAPYGARPVGSRSRSVIRVRRISRGTTPAGLPVGHAATAEPVRDSMITGIVGAANRRTIFACAYEVIE